MPSKRGYCNQCLKRWGSLLILLGEEGRLNRKFRLTVLTGIPRIALLAAIPPWRQAKGSPAFEASLRQIHDREFLAGDGDHLCGRHPQWQFPASHEIRALALGEHVAGLRGCCTDFDSLGPGAGICTRSAGSVQQRSDPRSALSPYLWILLGDCADDVWHRIKGPGHGACFHIFFMPRPAGAATQRSLPR
jgi:hypothetical protein